MTSATYPPGGRCPDRTAGVGTTLGVAPPGQVVLDTAAALVRSPVGTVGHLVGALPWLGPRPVEPRGGTPPPGWERLRVVVQNCLHTRPEAGPWRAAVDAAGGHPTVVVLPEAGRRWAGVLEDHLDPSRRVRWVGWCGIVTPADATVEALPGWGAVVRWRGLVGVCGHIPEPLGHSPVRRRALGALVEVLEDILVRGDTPRFVAGDLNGGLVRGPLRDIARRFGLRPVNRAPTWGPRPGGRAVLVLDHILVGGPVRVLDTRRSGPVPGTDHRRLTTLLSHPAGPPGPVT